MSILYNDAFSPSPPTLVKPTYQFRPLITHLKHVDGNPIVILMTD